MLKFHREIKTVGEPLDIESNGGCSRKSLRAPYLMFMYPGNADTWPVNVKCTKGCISMRTVCTWNLWMMTINPFRPGRWCLYWSPISATTGCPLSAMKLATWGLQTIALVPRPHVAVDEIYAGRESDFVKSPHDGSLISGATLPLSVSGRAQRRPIAVDPGETR